MKDQDYSLKIKTHHLKTNISDNIFFGKYVTFIIFLSDVQSTVLLTKLKWRIVKRTLFGSH